MTIDYARVGGLLARLPAEVRAPQWNRRYVQMGMTAAGREFRAEALKAMGCEDRVDETPNLGLPYIMAAQSQKHVTHNEAIRALDAVVQLSVLDRDLSAPPGSPVEGGR